MKQIHPLLSMEANECNIDENIERQQAELDFVKAAYTSNEAWCDSTVRGERCAVIHRRLSRSLPGGSISWILELNMPLRYPEEEILVINGHVDEDHTDRSLRKIAFDTLDPLLAVCKAAAETVPGEEAVFVVLSAAQEWSQRHEAELIASSTTTSKCESSNKEAQAISPTNIVLGRRLIYSHHIISKIKRRDMQQLGKDLKLTGFIKIGWPGLVILEGSETACQEFYETIRAWAWKYLVVRGEMQEKLPSSDDSIAAIDAARRFKGFTETDDMSIVADCCRSVGLEALFKTSMKQQAGRFNEGEIPSGDSPNGKPLGFIQGALVHVDHMNDGKSYRKLLRKICFECGVSIFIRISERKDGTRRSKPLIIVGLVGGDVANVLKQWRARKVDVDSKGRSCVERQITVLASGELLPVKDEIYDESVQFDDSLAKGDDRNLHTSDDKLLRMVEAVGGPLWFHELEQLVKRS